MHASTEYYIRTNILLQYTYRSAMYFVSGKTCRIRVDFGWSSCFSVLCSHLPIIIKILMTNIYLL